MQRRNSCLHGKVHQNSLLESDVSDLLYVSKYPRSSFLIEAAYFCDSRGIAGHELLPSALPTVVVGRHIGFRVKHHPITNTQPIHARANFFYHTSSTGAEDCGESELRCRTISGNEHLRIERLERNGVIADENLSCC